MKKILASLLIILLCSCSSDRKTITDGSIQASKETGIIIDTRDTGDLYGPVVAELPPSEIFKRQPVVAHVFPDALYLSSSYIGILKRYEQRDIPVNMLVASGFGALICTLYAKYKKTSLVEWKIFSLFQKIGTMKLYDNSWKEAIYQFLDSEFKNEKVEKYEIPLILPLYSRDLDKVIYVRKGLTRVILKSHFEFDPAKKLIVIPPQKLVLYSQKEIERLGADIVITYNPYKERIAFNNDDGFVWGIFNNVKNRIQSEFNLFENSFSIGASETTLDNWKETSKYISQEQRKAELYSIEIVQLMRIWDENNN